MWSKEHPSYFMGAPSPPMKYRWQRQNKLAQTKLYLKIEFVCAFVCAFFMYEGQRGDRRSSPHSMKLMDAATTCCYSAARRRMAHCVGARGQAGCWPALRNTPCRGFTPKLRQGAHRDQTSARARHAGGQPSPADLVGQAVRLRGLPQASP